MKKEKVISKMQVCKEDIELKFDPKELKRGHKIYRSEIDKRDAMYKVATFLVKHYWRNPKELANALGVLLSTWNNAFYRYGMFDYDALENAIEKNKYILKKYRKRDISEFVDADKEFVEILFKEFLKALKISKGKKKNIKSPVAVVKALHLLAPRFFPLWDDKIARAYKCQYSNNPVQKYVEFIRILKKKTENIKSPINIEGTSLLKIIDEYNFVKFTKKLV